MKRRVNLSPNECGFKTVENEADSQDESIKMIVEFVRCALNGDHERGFGTFWKKWESLAEEKYGKPKVGKRRKRKPPEPKRRVQRRELIFQATLEALKKH